MSTDPKAWVSDEEIVGELNSMITLTEKFGREGAKAIHSMLVIQCRQEPSGDFHPVVIRTDNIPADPEQRHRLFFSTGAHVAQVGSGFPVMAGMVHESWMLKAEAGEDVTRQRPSKHPRRVEAVIACVMSWDGRTAAKAWELRRRQDKTLVLIPASGFPEGICHVEDGTVLKPGLLMTLFEGVMAGLTSDG